MLKASLENNVSRFIFSSSSSVYGDSKKLPKVETMQPNPKSIYALTKLAAEYYCRLFYRLYDLETITLRYFNVFGKRQNPDSIYSAVIPIFIKKAKENNDLIIYGDGNQSRDFTHIDNVIYANYLTITSSNKNISGNYYNIACNKNTSLKEMIDILSKAFNKEFNIVYKKERTGDIKHSLASIEKARKDLLYKPKTYIEEGIYKYLGQLN
jgi:UDP-glucose 4-epimerase